MFFVFFLFVLGRGRSYKQSYCHC